MNFKYSPEKMNIELYSFLPSAPARMVLLLAKHLDVPLKVTNVDLFKQEQLKEEYLAVHTYIYHSYKGKIIIILA